MKHVQILQLKEDAPRHKKFASLRFMREFGLKVDLNEYRTVWSGYMDVEDAEDVYMHLQGIKPEGYDGHSLSVSDIVVIDGKHLFCDSYKFIEVTGARP
jgi:hypothetical protein